MTLVTVIILLSLLVSCTHPLEIGKLHSGFRLFGKAPLIRVDAHTRVPNKYIAVMAEPIYQTHLHGLFSELTKLSVDQLEVKALDASSKVSVVEVTAGPRAIDEVRKYKYVKFVEEVERVWLTGLNTNHSKERETPISANMIPLNVNPARQASCNCARQTDVESWGLDRVDQTDPGQSYTFSSRMPDVSPVDVYVLDTGVDIHHSDFEGRAIWGTDLVNKEFRDDNGHGTHVAGTIAGTKYGIAKTARIIALKVIDRHGSGSTATVLEGLMWVSEHRKRNPNRRGVINMSLSGISSTMFNLAIKALVSEGNVVVGGAGNDGSNACSYSPGSSPSAINVGCSDQYDRVCTFSNKGPCIDIYAPGKDIVSATVGNSTMTATRSGTSMSAAHVSGVVANYMGCNAHQTPQEVRNWLIYRSQKGKLQSLGFFSKSRLLYDSCQPFVSETVPFLGGIFKNFKLANI